MAYPVSSRLELIIDSTTGERRLREMEGRLDAVDKKGSATALSMQNLTKVVGVLGGVMSVRQLTNYADGWSELNSRVINVTKDVDIADKTMQRIVQTARTTYSSLQQTAETFLANSTALTELGYSIEQQLDLSDALNNSMVISATRGQEAASVMGALSRAFALGELRGDQLNTVIMNGGRLTEALAAGLNTTTLELRNMAQDGLLTTDRVFDALISQMQVLQQEAEDMPATIEDGFTLIGNAAQELVGTLDRSFGASEGIAGIMVSASDVMRESIEPLTENMDFLRDAAIGVAAVYAGRYASAIAGGTRKTIEKTAASIQAARAESTAAQQTERRTAAELQAARAAQARAVADAKATAGTNAHAFAMQNLSAASIRATEAQAAHTLAVNTSNAAMTRASVTARALSGAMTLVGGPVGAAVLAAGAIYYFRDALGITSAAARETKQEINELVDSLGDFTNAQYESNRVSIVQDLAEARVEAERLRREIEELEQQSQNQGMWYQGFSGSATHDIAELNTELREQTRVIAANEAGLEEYDRAWKQVLESQVTGVSIFRTLDQWLMGNAESALDARRSYNALANTLGESGKEWDDYINKLRGARDVLGMTADEAAAYAAQQQGFTGVYADMAAAVAGQTDALEGYRRAIAAGNDEEAQAHLDRARRFAEAEAMVQAQLLNMETLTSLLKGVQTELSAVALTSALTVADAGGAGAAYLANAIRMINERASAIQRTTTITQTNTAANREAREAERALANAERERQRVLDDSISAYSDLFKQLSPAGAATAEYNATVARLTVAYEDGTKSALEYYAAIGQAAKIYNEAVRAADPNIKRVEELSQQYDRQYQRGQQLTTAINDINAAYRRGDIDGQQYGRMIQSVRDEMAALALEADPLAQEMARAWEEASNRIDQTFADAFAGAFDSFDSFADQLQDGFKRLLAELAYQATLRPIVVGFTKDMRGLLGGGGVGGFANTIGAAQNLMNGSSLLGGASTAATAASAGGLYAGAATQTAGTLYGSAATGAAIGPAASAGIMSSITAGVSAAMPWIAGGLAIDGLLGGSITKAISGLFGGSKTNPHLNIDTRANDNFGHGSVRNGAFGAVGFGQGTRRSNELFGGIPEEREFLAAIAASDDLLASLARSPAELNRMAEAVQGVRLSASGVDGVMAQLSNRTIAAVSALDGEFGAFVSSLGTDVDTIIARTQSAMGALNLMGAASENLNLQFNASASGALRAADTIAQLAGGIDQLASLQDSYYQAFFSDAERAANLQRELTDALSQMGYALPATRDGFRALVEQQNQLTEAGQRNYVQLLQLAGAFDQMQNMLDQTSAGVDAFASRLAELNDQIGTLENDVRRAYQAFERQSFDQQLALLDLMGDSQASLALQRERELQGIDPLLHETQRFIWAMQDEAESKQRVTQAAQNYRREIERVREQLNSTLGGINQWIDQRNATSQTPGLNLEAAGEQFARQLVLAESGDRNALQSITQYADSYLTAGEAMFASGGAFQSIQKDVLDALKGLPEQISSEEYLAKEIRDALQDAVSQLPGGIASSLHPLFDSIDLDASGLIDWDEFYGAFQGMASDEELRRIFNKLDADGSGTISQLEALGKTSEGTKDNTQTLEERARDQLQSLNGLVSEMTRTTDQFVGLNSTMVSLRDSINALGVANDERASIERERLKAEQAERERIDRERQASALASQAMGVQSKIDEFYGLAEQTGQNANGNVDKYRGYGWIDGDQGAFLNQISSWTYQSQQAAWTARRLELAGGREQELERMRQEYQSLTGNAAPFAQGGVFTNSIVSSPTHFDMGLMGEAGPEAIMPLSRMAGGELGIRAELPPLPAFPLLGASDLTEVMRDMQRTIERQGKQITDLLRNVETNTGNGANATAKAAMEAKRQRDAQLRETENQSRTMRLQKKGNVA
ncbi:tape measure protein [Vreelandella populi]|uniref:tape measure protein n=1 Tax=Vreelandella populi TaxID=2498858 RepID=UPI000F8ECE49|nr:tape measure protein [Halomonas populi]RUR52686.1 hypothetical protein ELY40_11590 [Halomonas populi]